MPAPAPDETGRRLALVIASATYRDPTLQQLRAPGRDAGELAEILGDPAVGGFEVTSLLDTPSDQQRLGVAEFCQGVDPGDLLLIYLSCHGVLDDRGRLYYASTDTKRTLLSATALSAQWLSEQLDDCRARRQILLLDCCHSGAFAKGSKGDSNLALKDRFSGRGKVVLTASRATEYSFEGQSVQGEPVRSVFTHAVVDGLRTGQADCDKDGLVTVTDLYHHVYEWVKKAEPRQTPELWTYGAEGDLLVARSPRGAIIEPVPLPEYVQMALESSRASIRESGVGILAELLDHGEPGVILTARETLQRVSEEDLPRVAALARTALRAQPGQAQSLVEAEELTRRESRERARRDAEARNLFDEEMEPYLGDPFRGAVERRILAEGDLRPLPPMAAGCLGSLAVSGVVVLDETATPIIDLPTLIREHRGADAAKETTQDA